MWPWEHLVFGYFVYSMWRRLSGRAPPTDATALLVAFGTQFPDLVDKPLAWSFDLIPNGRSLSHSLVSATLVVAVALYVARRRDRLAWGTAFAVGYYSHILGDAVAPLFGGSWYELGFLLWPVLPAADMGEGGFLYYLTAFELTPLVAAQLLVLVVPAVLLWVADGTPGTALFGWLQSRVTARH